jgi:peptide/nickel transport system ATP-binding protein
MSNALLEIRNLKKHFKVNGGYLHAVDGISFKIDKGKTLGVVGESGCGKSTLGRAVLRLHEPTSGDIFFEGKNITRHKKSEMKTIRKDMQIIFQDPYSSLNPRMSIQELIAEPIIINKAYDSKNDIFKKVAYLMELVGLDKRLSATYPHELDGGRRQRIGIARALALNPKFIVCDEPVSALDVSIQAQILNLLMDLQDELGLTYMFITHDLSVVRHISTDIAVMYLGKCVELCPSKELFQNPIHPYTKALLSSIPVPKSEMRHKKIEIIKGELTSPVNPKPGCRFFARCPNSQECCTQEDLPLAEISKGHFVSCSLCK